MLSRDGALELGKKLICDDLDKELQLFQGISNPETVIKANLLAKIRAMLLENEPFKEWFESDEGRNYFAFDFGWGLLGFVDLTISEFAKQKPEQTD